MYFDVVVISGKPKTSGTENMKVEPFPTLHIDRPDYQPGLSQLLYHDYVVYNVYIYIFNLKNRYRYFVQSTICGIHADVGYFLTQMGSRQASSFLHIATSY